MPRLQGALKRWNKEVFGNIFERKRKLIKRLEELDNQLATQSSPLLDDTKKAVWHEYEQVLAQEKLLWYQKSRSKWLYFGDRNTRFFHGVTAIKRRRNTYDILQDKDGNWIGDQHELENMVSSFYRNLFKDDSVHQPTPISGAFPSLSEESCRLLEKNVSRRDIFNVINYMHPFKAPGIDGLQAIFFQSQWHVIGNFVCNLIQDIFRHPEQVSKINETLITLVPKVDPVVSICNFRPIILCNVSYKIITKILAQRLRQMMGSLVNPCQSSFIPNRQCRDNIILAQEIFHSMRNKRGKKGWMAIKLDLEKAYDRLSWPFIKETLVDIGFPVKFINLVWHCISSPRMRMLWNGEALDEFTPSRGIRQGDPISPYLFVLCIEKLFQMVSLVVDLKHWRPIQLTRGGAPLIPPGFC